MDEAPLSTILFGIILALEKAITVHDSNKFIEEYMPLKKQLNVKMKTLQQDAASSLRVRIDIITQSLTPYIQCALVRS